jgi:hypothetical protein
VAEGKGARSEVYGAVVQQVSIAKITHVFGPFTDSVVQKEKSVILHVKCLLSLVSANFESDTYIFCPRTS